MTEGFYKPGIRFSGDNFDRRISSFPGKIEGYTEHNQGNHYILPGIQHPLPIPGELIPLANRPEINNRPLISIRSPTADKVAN